MNNPVQKLSILNVFLKCRIFFGYCHNVSHCCYKSVLLKVVSVLIGAAILYIGIKCPLLKQFDLFSVVKLFQYISYVVCALITENLYLINYYNADIFRDSVFSKTIYNKINKLIIHYIIFVHIYYTVLGFSFYFSSNYPCQSWVDFSVIIYVSVAIDLGFLLVILILFLLYLRSSFLCKKIRTEAVHLTTAFNWKKYVNIYIKHIETLEETDWPTKFMMVVHFIVSFISISITQLDVVRSYKNHELNPVSFYYICVMTLYTVHEYIKAFCPAIIMEFILNEMDTLNIEIADKMITCTDARRKEHLHKMLTRFHSRPLTYTIWRAVRVDSSLPLGFLSLSATCLVCLLQFTPVLESNND